MGFRGRQMKKKAIKKLITLNQIKAKEPCSDEWEKLLEYSDKIGRKMDDEFEITDIIKSNSIRESLWALRVLKGFDKEKRLFDCDCAMLVIDVFEKEYPKDKRPRIAIETSRRFANDEVTVNELNTAKTAINIDCLGYAYWAAMAANSATSITPNKGALTAWNAALACRGCNYSQIQKLFLKHFKN